jgi:glutamyl-tRNA reductase
MVGASAAELDADGRATLEAQLRSEAGGVRGAAGQVGTLLATCHRVELYGVGEPPSTPAPLQVQGPAVVRRLFRVAVGLESAVLGEDDVLHQVRDALAEARRERSLDGRVGRLFEEAIAAGRRARALDARRGPGLARAAVAWLQSSAPLGGGRVLVAGSGTMGRALARALREEGATVLVAGRDLARADVDLTAAARLAGGMSAIAVALRGPWTALAGAAADGLPPIADLSAPSAVPAPLRSTLRDRFLGIDDLYTPAVEGEEPSPWAARAELIAESGIAAYLAWLQSRGSANLVRALRARSEERRQERLDRFLRTEPDLSDEARARLEALTRRIVGDLLHEPLVALRADDDGSGGTAARRLFGL